MSAFVSQSLCTLITVVLLKPISGQTCVEHTQTLPVALRGHEVIYSSQTKNAYIFGGDPAEAQIFKWDLEGAFQTIGSIPPSASRFYTWSSNAILIDNIIWFIGMRYKDSYESDLIFKYNVMTEQWEDTSNLLGPPVPLSYGCLATNQTHAFLVDGKSDSLDRNPRVLQIYNIADNQWTTHTTPYDDNDGYIWEYQYCHIVNNELFVFGGRFEYTGQRVPYDYQLWDIHKYNLHLNQWSKLPVSLPGSPYGGKTVFYNDVLYLVGDFTRNITRAFNTNTQTFDETMTLPTSVEQAGVILVDNIIYAFGGRLGSSAPALSVIQYCTLPTKEPTAAPSVNPSEFPSNSPSINPSTFPSVSPSTDPSAFPSLLPSINPSYNPSESSVNPTVFPSTSPSTIKSTNPSTFPSVSPAVEVTLMASRYPTAPTHGHDMDVTVMQTNERDDAGPTEKKQFSTDILLVVLIVVILIVIGAIVFVGWRCCIERRKCVQNNQTMVQNATQKGPATGVVIDEDERMDIEGDLIENQMQGNNDSHHNTTQGRHVYNAKAVMKGSAVRTKGQSIGSNRPQSMINNLNAFVAKRDIETSGANCEGQNELAVIEMRCTQADPNDIYDVIENTDAQKTKTIK